MTMGCLTSCGNKEKEKTEVKVKQIVLPTINYANFKIANRDKRYFKMVDGGSTEMKLNTSGEIEVVAEFEIVKTFKKKLGEGMTEQAFVSIIALDDNGRDISLSIVGNGEMRSNDSDGIQFADFLRGKKGSKSTFVFKSWSRDDEAKKKLVETAKSIKGFRVLTEGLNY